MGHLLWKQGVEMGSERGDCVDIVRVRRSETISALVDHRLGLPFIKKSCEKIIQGLGRSNPFG